MNREKLKNNPGEREILSADERRISELLGGLDKVSAPNDFDFRLKARIANADRKDFQPSIRRALRYLLPVTATAVIAAFVVIQGGLFSTTAIPAENNFVAENSVPAETNRASAPIDNALVSRAAAATRTPEASVTNDNSDIVKYNERNTTAANPLRREVRFEPKSPSKDNFKGYKDSALKSSRTEILPAGIPNQANSPDIQNREGKPFPASEMFEIIGVETETVAGKIVVKSVKEKSIAGLSGVQAGDSVEAIDDVKTDETGTNQRSNGFKKVTVLRNGKLIEIVLKTN